MKRLPAMGFAGIVLLVATALAQTPAAPPKTFVPSKIQALTLQLAHDKAADAYGAYVAAVNALNAAGEEVKKQNAACSDKDSAAQECVAWGDPSAALQFHGDTLQFLPPPPPPKPEAKSKP